MNNSPQSVGHPARSAYLDNAKGLLIVLVALGHVLELGLSHHPAYGALYKFIYLFHMPAFVLISGYLSKNDRFSWAWLRDLTGLAALYLVFQVAYACFYNFAMGQPTGFGANLVTYPIWIMWYLCSLIAWRLLLPLTKWTMLTLPLSLVIAVVAGALLTDSAYLSLMRTAYFWPFFLLGYWLTRSGFDVSRTFARLRPHALIVLALVFLYCFIEPLGHVDNLWLYGRTFSALNVEAGHGMGVRALILLLSVLCTAAFLIAVPAEGVRVLNWLGARTLPIYVWHGLAVKGLMISALAGWVAQPFFVAVAVLIICAVCGSRPAEAVAGTVQKLGALRFKLPRAV